MDKNHRDRIAFLRICSGKFEKGMSVTHVQRNKKIKLSQPQQFVAQDRVIIDSAYPGDIIGIHDPGIFNLLLNTLQEYLQKMLLRESNL